MVSVGKVDFKLPKVIQVGIRSWTSQSPPATYAPAARATTLHTELYLYTSGTYYMRTSINNRRSATLTSTLVADPECYVCTVCCRTYKHKASWYAHRRYECGKEPQFHCQLCPYKAKLKGNLYSHIRLRHPHSTLLLSNHNDLSNNL